MSTELPLVKCSTPFQNSPIEFKTELPCTAAMLALRKDITFIQKSLHVLCQNVE